MSNENSKQAQDVYKQLSQLVKNAEKAKALDNQSLTNELINIWAEYKEESWESAVLAEAIERLKLTNQ